MRMRSRKRSSCGSGRAWVPSYSSGFCVASTMNGLGNGYVEWSSDTCASFMASSKLDCVLGVVRLISSASTMLVKSGPGLNTKSPRSAWYTVTPRMSEGSMSEVNWMRWKPPPMERASAAARVVLPTPGTSSISRCPRASRPMIARRMTSGLPTRTCATLSSSRRIRSSASAIHRSYCNGPEVPQTDRQPRHPDTQRANGVGDGVGDGRRRPDRAPLAHALDTARHEGRGGCEVADFEGGNVLGPRQRVVHERGRQQLALGVVDDRLQQRLAQPLGHRPVDLPLHDGGVHDRPAVFHHHVALHAHVPGGAIDLDRRD